MYNAVKIDINEIENLYSKDNQPDTKKHSLIILKELFVNAFQDSHITLSGQKIMDTCFPIVKKANVFLSHSHRDLEKVRILKVFLEKRLGLQCFIDSDIWYDSYELLKQIDSCFNEEGNGLRYRKSQQIAANVYLMLSTALTYMLDKCPLIIFVSSPNSQISYSDSHILLDKTYSPWLFHEISMVHLLPRKRPMPPVVTESIHKTASVRISYPLGVTDLPILDAEKLNALYSQKIKQSVYQSCSQRQCSYDILCNLCGIQD